MEASMLQRPCETLDWAGNGFWCNYIWSIQAITSRIVRSKGDVQGGDRVWSYAIRDECNMMNLPSLLGRDDSGGGHCPGQVQGQGQGQGWFWAWGGARLSQRHKWKVNILVEAKNINKNMTHLNHFIILTLKMMLKLLIRMHYISPGSDVTWLLSKIILWQGAGLIIYHSTIIRNVKVRDWKV